MVRILLKLPRIGRFNTPRSAIITDYSCDAGEKKKKKKKKKGGVRVAASRCANLHNEATRTVLLFACVCATLSATMSYFGVMRT